MDEQHLPSSLLLSLTGVEDAIDTHTSSSLQNNEISKQTKIGDEDEGDDDEDTTFFKIPPNTFSHSTKTYKFYGNELLGKYILIVLLLLDNIDRIS